MYVLSLRKLTDPTGRPDAIARSDTAAKLWSFVELHTIRPVMRNIEGRMVMCVFEEGSELAEYAAPNPADAEEGVIYIDSLDARVDVMLNALRPRLEEQVRAADEILVNGTIEI